MNTILIPGLSMKAHEIRTTKISVLENPCELDGLSWQSQYSLEQVANYHLKKILELNPDKKAMKLIGMSMGGMILSIIASELRDQIDFPIDFNFVVTSSNSQSNPAISDERLKFWSSARFKDVKSFSNILEDFFSLEFRENSKEVCNQYYSYRANGENKQSPAEFMRQVTAIRTYEGEKYFKNLNPEECTVYHGKNDYILDEKHLLDILKCNPDLKVKVIESGHMINLEIPNFFESIM